MKQISHPWAKFIMPMLIVACAVVLLAVTAFAKSPAAASNDAVLAPAVPTAPPSAIFISVKSNSVIEDDFNGGTELKFKRNDILQCTPNAQGDCGSYSVYLHGDTDLGIKGANLMDFEVLSNGDVLFVIDRKKTLAGIADQVTPRDVIRYHASDGSLTIELKGSDIGLTKSSEDIDAVAYDTANGHLIISTYGTATFSNNLKVQDRDLVAIVGGVPTLFFDGDQVGMKSSDEDIGAASLWEGDPNASERNLYLVTKGSFHVSSVNSLSGKKSDIFGCSPGTSADPITSCFFFKFFAGKDQGLNKQLDGISIFTGPIPKIVASATHNAVNAAADDDSVNTEEYVSAMNEGADGITSDDFIDVNQQVFLPVVMSR